jgi:hypothetical protein
VSLKSYDFRCTKCRHEFEDLSSFDETRGGVQPVPCELCAGESIHFWKLGTRMTVRGDSEISRDEQLQCFAQTGERVTSRSELNKALKKHGFDMKVDAATFNAELERIAAIDEAPVPQTVEELHKGMTQEQIEKRRAEIMPDIKRARELAAAGQLPPRTIPADAPDEVKAAAAGK